MHTPSTACACSYHPRQKLKLHTYWLLTPISMVTFIFYTMHLCVQINHFNHALWVAVQCEASEATCFYNIIYCSVCYLESHRHYFCWYTFVHHTSWMPTDLHVHQLYIVYPGLYYKGYYYGCTTSKLTQSLVDFICIKECRCASRKKVTCWHFWPHG